jgi:hypothetical protein
MTVVKISKHKLHFVGVQMGQMNQQANIHFSMERGMRIVNYVQVSLYVQEL